MEVMFITKKQTERQCHEELVKCRDVWVFQGPDNLVLREFYKLPALTSLQGVERADLGNDLMFYPSLAHEPTLV